MHIKCLAQFGADDNLLPSPPLSSLSSLSCLVPLSLLLITVLSLIISTSSVMRGTFLSISPATVLGRSSVPWTTAVDTELVSLTPISPIFSISHPTARHSVELSVPLPCTFRALACHVLPTYLYNLILPLPSVHPRFQLISHFALYLAFAQFFLY